MPGFVLILPDRGYPSPTPKLGQPGRQLPVETGQVRKLSVRWFRFRPHSVELLSIPARTFCVLAPAPVLCPLKMS